MKLFQSHESNGTDSEQQQQATMSITTITTTVSIGDPFEVQYARFFNCPFSSTSHPTLLPLAKKPKNSWISSSSLASLRLLATADHSVILTVTLVGHVIEEHYISKLNFTWPQVSCLTGYSPRGSKVVFMSYKDEVGQIQKFVVRFLAIDEAERFINFLKEAFGQNGSISGIYKSNTSSESEFIPSFEAENRPIQDWDLITTSAEFSEPIYRPIQDSSSRAACDYTYIQPFYPIENHDGRHLSQDVQEKLSAFPPSFTSNSAPMYRWEII
ncbi:protein POOR HOMOLOGOUS SYNAPSIS 1-like [Bidens hawaiensis]|uniref:protein POOR HOMOLOGOUS SYNAPSIS 1-like n=1 Tax=Bidens hawaiensis TaxID=980011 RepID=UPI00404A504E